MAPRESKQTLFRLADKILTIAQKLLERIGGMRTGDEENLEAHCEQGGVYLYIAGLFLHSAAADFGVIFFLLEKEFINGAFPLLRRLCELAIDLRFIGNCPAERSRQFCYYGKIQVEEHLRLLEKADWTKTVAVDEAKRNSIRVASEEAMKALGDPKVPFRWSPHYSWMKKCLEIDRKLQESGQKLRGMPFVRSYEVVYKYCCAYTHPSYFGLTTFVKDIPDEVPIYAQPVREGLIIAALANTIFLDIILIVDQIFGTGLDGEISEIYKRLDGWGPF